jgi:tetratricopeptide (TPR) repeat protein
VLIALFALAALPARASELARADRVWAQRAEGAREGRAAPGPIAEALRAYETALAAEPSSLEARWKLLRALHFQGDFATADPAARRAIFERACALAEESLALLAERSGDLASLSDAALRARLAEAGVSPRDAAGVQFWSAVAWGAWSQTHGLLDAVRKGVANRIHLHAELAHRIDPALEEGGPLRLLARLHGTLPRVPLISGWVDRERAVPLAEEVVERWPGHPGNHFLVALTWLELEPARRDDALTLLAEVAASERRASHAVEDDAVRRAASERLARERAPAS